MRELPGALSDPLRAIEPLPGVTPALSGVPYFFVRGAPPSNVGYYFDGMRLPALFHALGGPSVVHPGLVESVELFAGPYPVEYGRHAGGIVVARSTEPAAQAHGELSLRATDSSALIDAPLGSATSLTLSGRYSYANPVLQLFAPEMSVEYQDYQARATHRLSARTRVSVLAFGAHDALTRRDDDGKERTTYGVDFHRVVLRLDTATARSSLRVQTLGGWDHSLARDGSVSVEDALSETRADWQYAATRELTLRSGASFGVDRYGLSVSEVDDPNAARDYAERFPTRVETVVGAYLACDVRLGGVTFTPGVRSDVYSSRGEQAVGVDPRLSAEYRLNRAVSVRAAVGIAHQPPASSIPSPGLNPTLAGGLQRAVQHSYAVRLRLPAQVSLDVGVFQSALFNLTDSVGETRARESDQSITETTRSLGWARGFELLLKRSLTRKLGGFLSYTLSQSKRAVGRLELPSSYDRRHVLSAALGYHWGAGISSGVRGSFYTGIPADVAYAEAARNPPRTAPYFRLDFRTEKRWEWGQRYHLSVVLEVVNATLNREALRKSCDAYDCREQRIGPITIPNLGIEAGF